MGKYVHYIIIGICCGILLGLALSPVIEKTLSAIVAFVITLMGIASGVTIASQADKPKFTIDPAPLSLLLLGMIFGSFVGIYLRTHNSLGVDDPIAQEVKKDQKAAVSKTSAENVTGLHSAGASPCAIFGTMHGNELRKELEKLGDPKVDSCLRIAKDSGSLEIIKTLICH